jgi:hypothetical protein
MEGLDFLGQAETILPGQPDIHEDKPGVKSLYLLKGFPSIGGFRDFKGWELIQQKFLQGEPEGRVVFDDKNRKHENLSEYPRYHFTIDGDCGK